MQPELPQWQKDALDVELAAIRKDRTSILKWEDVRSKFKHAQTKNMDELVFEIEESADCGFIARCLNASIFTEADTFEELQSMIADAVSCHYESSTQSIPTIRLIRIS